MNYNDLKPGIHLYRGDKKIKSLSLTDADQWAEIFNLDSRTPDVEKLGAVVSWNYIALDYRRNMIGEIPVDWELNGEEAEAPIDFDFDRDAPRIDTALQLRSVCYLLKRRVGSILIGLRWLDPSSIKPDPFSLTSDGYQVYEYTTSNMGILKIPAEDILRILIPGQREHDPAPSAAGSSSLAAQIILGMEESADTFYDTNGLPVIAVMVPGRTTQPDEVTRISDQFKRIFRGKRSRDGNKTIGLKEGTQIETISFAPKDLAMSELEESKRSAILLSHAVPPSIVYKDVNRAESELKLAQFVGTIAGRLNLITKTINQDEDIQRTGVELVVHAERHEQMQVYELAKAEALQRLTQKPIITVNEARERLELDPIDGGDEMQAEPVVMPNFQMEEAPGPEVDVSASDKSAELIKLRRFIKKGLHHKRDFVSDILTPFEINKEVGAAQDAPFPEWQQYP
jgi:hypothetical protein